MNDPQSPPPPHGFLGRPAVPGYESGRRLIAECDEFKLFEHHKPGGPRSVERSPQVEAAYLKAVFRKNDDREKTNSTKLELRLSWAAALRDLASFTDFNAPALFESPPTAANICCVEGSKHVAVSLARTIGARLISLSKESDIEQAIEDCLPIFKAALLGYAREQSLIVDKKQQFRFSVDEAILMNAEALFYRTGERPRKSDVRDVLESIGYKYSPRNANTNWRKAFERVALGGLPP